MNLSEWFGWIGERLGFGGTGGHACIEGEGVSEVARAHAMAPRNYGTMESCQGNARITGPCGDTMEFWLGVRDGKVERISFITTGCGPSLASGSMTTTLAEGKSIADAAALRQKDVLDALQGLPAESEHCALLAVSTLRAACDDYLNRGKENA
jgi:nitrogen fixation NifU-like protein